MYAHPQKSQGTSRLSPLYHIIIICEIRNAGRVRIAGAYRQTELVYAVHALPAYMLIFED